MAASISAVNMGGGACHNSPVQVRRIVVLLAAASAFACTSTITYIGPYREPFCNAGTLGLEPGEITHALRQSLKLPADFTGATVDEVLPGGPADVAGLKKGDVVVKVGTKAITNACELIDEAFDRRGCTPVSVTLQ